MSAEEKPIDYEMAYLSECTGEVEKAVFYAAHQSEDRVKFHMGRITERLNFLLKQYKCEGE